MSYSYKNLEVKKLSVIGAGQIGPDILLHFANSFAGHEVNLVLVDISEEAIKNAEAKISKKIQKLQEIKVINELQAIKMKSCIGYSTDYHSIAGSDIVVEAATENETIKQKIFSHVEALCSAKTIMLSNSSHMQPEEIFKSVKDKSRCLVAHYFFPADRNPVVEIVPSEFTDQKIVKLLIGIYESIGKVPIEVKSSYGFAIDPIFEGLCQSAILCLENGWGDERQIDKVACETLGLGVGPFTALTLTGGNPITAHGLERMHQLIHPWFRTPQTLNYHVEKKLKWNTAGRDEAVEVPGELRRKISEEFLGAYFSLAAMMIDTGITNVNDLDMACELALVIKPPFTLMNEMGLDNVFEIVKSFEQKHPSFTISLSLINARINRKWNIEHVVKSIHNNIAILTIRRPKVLNAINSEIMSELHDKFKSIEQDKNISGVIITGFGTKAFISGADIHELASHKSPEEGIANSRHFQRVLNFIEGMSKPVVCAMNGYAFGGGNELAMACTIRICKKDLPVAFCQPEVNLGFIPGAGGTQRLPRIIGIGKAAEILRTGRMVSSKEAVEVGYIYKEVEGDLIEEAITILNDITTGKIVAKKISQQPLTIDEVPQELNIGHHSKAIDNILCNAIYSGASMKLEDGLKLESKLFGECMLTRDMKIGVDTFMNKGAKAKPEFING